MLQSGAYSKISGDFTTQKPTDLLQSNPFEYLSGGSKLDNKLFTYTTGIIDGNNPFAGWYDNDNHYFMKICGLDESELFGNILHITLGCGNDTGRAELPVPEPTTLLLLGGGLLGLAFYTRKRTKA